jgi:hypothetical protein
VTLKFALTLACATLESKVFVHPDYAEAVRVIRQHFPDQQAQDSTTDQLRRAIPILDNAGLYDAADTLRAWFAAQEKRG